ncbi:tape measure protein [Paenibacillus sp. TAB 01]|uniref:tape measure protein n=1 Tax=Paenibacillus sp. TAB 01 TaxID=3368988 RepID=UPI0037535387
MGSKVISKTMVLRDGVTQPLNKISRGTVEYKNKLKELKEAGEEAWSGIKKGALAATAAMGAVGAGAVGLGVKTNAGMETAGRSFDILLGSASKAQVMVSDLQKLATQSPFEFAGLQDAAKTLIGMGFSGDKVVPMLHSLGDAVAAVGGDTEQMKGIALAIGQIQSKGKLSAEEVNQLAERGVPAWQLLAKEMGKSTGELMNLAANGELLSDQVIPALMKGLDSRFGGSMEAMSDTFSYTVANMIETATLGLAGVTKPLFEAMKKDLQGVQGLLSGDGVAAWSNLFSQGLLNVYNGTKAVASVLFSITNFVVNNWGFIGPIVYGVAAAFAAYGIALLVVRGYSLATTAATWLMARSQLGLAAAVRLNPIGVLATVLGLLVIAGTYVIQNWEQIKLYGMQLWNTVVGAAEWAVNKYLVFANFMLRFYKFAWDSIEFSGKSIWNGIISAGEAGVNGFIGLIDTMVDRATSGLNTLIRGANQVSNKLGYGNVADELSFGGFGKVDFGGAKANIEKPKWESDLNLIPKVDFDGAKFSEDSIMAQTKKAQADRDKKKSDDDKEMTDTMAGLTEALNANTAATTENTAKLKDNSTPLEIADSLLGRIERHLYAT